MNPLDVVTLGEAMMAFEAQEHGPLRDVTFYKKWVGGAELTVSIGLARLGFQSGWASRVGDDEFGKDIIRQARGEGVDVTQVLVDNQAPTGVFFVERHAQQEFKCYYYRQHSAASKLCPADLDSDYFAQARIVCLTGITPALSDSARETTQKMLHMALENEQVVVFDPNLRLTLWDLENARAVLVPIMQKSHYVLAGDEELMLLMECSNLDQAREKAHTAGIENLIIKMGDKGAMLACRGQKVISLAPFKVNHPMSSMGAGDSFMAGFIAGLLKDAPLVECMRWGNALGAFCVMAREPYYALPSLEELMAFLANQSVITR